ncbi:MAG: hypothetical protein AAGG81_04825, partial [Chlamydiota bacterium]
EKMMPNISSNHSTKSILSNYHEPYKDEKWSDSHYFMPSYNKSWYTCKENTPQYQRVQMAYQEILQVRHVKSQKLIRKVNQALNQKELMQPQISEELRVQEKPQIPEKNQAQEEPQVSEESRVQEQPQVQEKPQIPEKNQAQEEPQVSEESRLQEQPQVQEKPQIPEKNQAQGEPQVSEEPRVQAKPQISEQRQEPEKKQTQDDNDSLKKIGFFTPVKYFFNNKTIIETHGLKGKVVEFFDNYFFLGGKRAEIFILDSKRKGTGVLEKAKEYWYMIALKVVSYATLIIPAIMLVGKAIARSFITYQIDYDVIECIQIKDEKKGHLKSGDRGVSKCCQIKA